jgi:hypothetical protein
VVLFLVCLHVDEPHAAYVTPGEEFVLH